MSKTEVCSDLNELVPVLARIVEQILIDMRALGWNPILFETLRTPERGAYLQSIGRSKNGSRSMHTLRLAADIVDGDLNNVPKMTKEGYWNAPDKFWADLEDLATKYGLTRLYKVGVKPDSTDDDAESWDKPHVQACTVAEQNKLRRMRTDEERAAWCAIKFEATLAALDAAGGANV
jgi:hypothetical protein